MKISFVLSSSQIMFFLPSFFFFLFSLIPVSFAAFSTALFPFFLSASFLRALFPVACFLCSDLIVAV
jgi:hypothetical protein